MSLAPKQIGKANKVANITASGTVGAASSTVDGARSLSIAQTTAAIALMLPNPSDTVDPVALDIINSGTASFTMNGLTIAASRSARFAWSPDLLAWTVPVGSASSTLPASFMYGHIAAGQTSGIGSNGYLRFDTVDVSAGSDILFNASTYTFTLAPNKTYSLRCGVTTAIGTNPNFQWNWYNVSAGAKLGPIAVLLAGAASQSSNYAQGGIAEVLFTPTVTTTVAVQTNVGSGTVTALGGTGDPWFDIQVVAAPSAALLAPGFSQMIYAGGASSSNGSSTSWNGPVTCGSTPLSLGITTTGASSNVRVYFRGVCGTGPSQGDTIYGIAIDGGTPVPITSMNSNLASGLALEGEAVFTGIAAGSHTVALWQRDTNSSGGGYVMGDANRPLQLIVEEVFQTSAPLAGVMLGASSSQGGASGLVPVPSTGQQDAHLAGDGTWDSTGRMAALKFASLNADPVPTAPMSVDQFEMFSLSSTKAVGFTVPTPTASAKYRRLIVSNFGAFNISLANTMLNGTANALLAPGQVYMLVWSPDANTWLVVQ